MRRQQPDGLVFFLHGNAGNLDNWFRDADFYRQLNLDLVMLDYRGYGKSGGRITGQQQMLSDIRAAWDAVSFRYEGLRRIIIGRSLGTGFAAALAVQVQPELTVLVSPYTSMRKLAREQYPWIPGLLVSYPLRTEEWLPRIRGDVLLLHGARDLLITPTHSERLQTLSATADLILIPDAGHDDLNASQTFRDALRSAIAPSIGKPTPLVFTTQRPA